MPFYQSIAMSYMVVNLNVNLMLYKFQDLDYIKWDRDGLVKTIQSEKKNEKKWGTSTEVRDLWFRM